MKKILSLVLCAFIIVGFTACGGGKSKFIGKWEATKAVAPGTSVEIDVKTIIGEEFSLELKDGGKAQVTLGKMKGAAEWKEEGKGITVKEKGQEMKFVEEKGKLYVEQSGVKIYFEKK
ncbi:MAG: hypothetical protein PUI85_00950 [Eubacteriales bacterium]|nr:hypothetical protein [Eubacteriales bacterium]MDY3332713.1 hypothetical protein [Gallibacter sp.]